jgi:glycosyltransferase involved in cell wall biosynthesis
MPVSQPFRFTVFIPTFNRAYILPKALESVSRQSYRGDFEVIVVDDGSTDNTKAIVSAFAATAPFPVGYHYQANQGKHAAHNKAVGLARGELFVLLDSDDVLLPDALQSIDDAWNGIPSAARPKYAGIEGLCLDAAGAVMGQSFPRDPLDSNYLEVTRRYGVSGEKRNAIRLDVLRRYPYPVVEAERHIRPSFIWKRMAHEYLFRYINKPLQVVDFRQDGLTATSSRRRLRNPVGLRLYWHDDLLHHQDYLTWGARLRSCSQYIRYSLHSDHSIIRQWAEVPAKGLWLLALPRGVSQWCADRLKRVARRY